MIQLTSQERDFLEQVFPLVRKHIKRKAVKKRDLFLTDVDSTTDQAISYLAQVLQEWDSKKKKLTVSNFVRFASHRCMLRLADEYRSVHMLRITRNSIRLKKIAERDRLVKQKGYAYDEEVNVVLNKKKPYIFPSGMNSITLQSATYKSPSPKLDFLDLQDHIVDKAKDTFKDKKQGDVYYSLLVDYLLPNCVNDSRRTLGSVQANHNLSIPRLSRMFNDGTIQDFLKEIIL